MKKFFAGVFLGGIIAGLVTWVQYGHVTYHLCDSKLGKCEPPQAWFSSREQCEFYSRFQNANCDSVSQAGKALCDFTRPAGVVTGVCK